MYKFSHSYTLSYAHTEINTDTHIIFRSIHTHSASYKPHWYSARWAVGVSSQPEFSLPNTHNTKTVIGDFLV